MIVLAYDHRAFELMQKIKEYLTKKNLEYIEFASKEYDKNDSYSFYTKQANEYILSHKDVKGIYSCRSGIGVCMMANRSKGIRAGMCNNEKLAFLGRNDDNINVLILSSEEVSFNKAKKIIDVFLNTKFEGGRHITRLKLLDE